MCSGAILLYRIPRVVVGENVNFQGEEELLRSRGVEVIVADDKDCIDLMKKFIEEKPEVRGCAVLSRWRSYFEHAGLSGMV
jgi:cytosine/creatinine deaminase